MATSSLLQMSAELPPGSRVRTILEFTRSPGQDVVAVGCALVDSVGIFDLSAPQGADADALAIAGMP